MRSMPRRGHAWAFGYSETQRVRNRNPAGTQWVLMPPHYRSGATIKGLARGLRGACVRLAGSLAGRLTGRLSAGRRFSVRALGRRGAGACEARQSEQRRAPPLARFYKGGRISDSKNGGHPTPPDAGGQSRCPVFGFRRVLLSDFRPFAVRNPADQLRFSMRAKPCLKPGADACRRMSPRAPSSAHTGCSRYAARLALSARSRRLPPAPSAPSAACRYSPTRAPSCRYRSR